MPDSHIVRFLYKLFKNTHSDIYYLKTGPQACGRCHAHATNTSSDGTIETFTDRHDNSRVKFASQDSAGSNLPHRAPKISN